MGVGLEYRTNVFLQETDTTAAPNLWIVPKVDVEAKGPSLAFGLSAQYEMRKYLQKSVTALDRFSDFAFAANLDALNESVLGFRLSDSAALQNNPTNSLASDQPFVTQFRNTLDGGVVVRPGPALEIATTGQFSYDDFRVPEGAQVGGGRGFNTRSTYGPTGDIKWTFFPRTALVLDWSYLLHNWSENFLTAGGDNPIVGDNLAMPDSAHFKLQAGLRGRMTQRIVVVLTAGYGSAKYNADSVTEAAGSSDGEANAALAGFDASISGVGHLLMTAQLVYEIDRDKRIVAGYRKDFVDSYFTNYMDYNDFTVRFDGKFGERFGTNAEVTARIETYAGELPTTARQDTLLRVKGDLAFYIQDWMNISGGAWWVQRASRDDDSVEYDDVNIHLMTNISY